MRPAIAAAFLCLFVGCDDADPAVNDATLGDAPDAEITLDAGALDAGALDATPDAEPDASPPPAVDERGPWSVGFHTESISFTDPSGELRALDLHWWYPTLAEDGTAPRYSGFHLRQAVIADAEPALDEPAPVLVFSHGNGGFAEQSFFFTEHLASHGWVVVAMDHTGNTFLDAGTPTHELFELRPLDVIATLDHTDALPDTHLLHGQIGPQRALAGHSFGGYTSLVVGGAQFDVDAMVGLCDAAEPGERVEECAYLEAAEDRFRGGYGDDRLQALIPMTPAGATLLSDGISAIEVPTLLMTGDRDATLPDAAEGDPIWAALQATDAETPALRLAFPNAGHFTFSDGCALVPGLAEDDGCGDTFLESTEAHRLINGYSLAFLQLHLLGDDADADLLDGTRTLGDEAVLHQK